MNEKEEEEEEEEEQQQEEQEEEREHTRPVRALGNKRSNGNNDRVKPNHPPTYSSSSCFFLLPLSTDTRIGIH